jgi:hypothetical protein
MRALIFLIVSLSFISSGCSTISAPKKGAFVDFNAVSKVRKLVNKDDALAEISTTISAWVLIGGLIPQSPEGCRT